MSEAIDDGVVEDPTVGRYAREMGRAVGQLSSLVDDLFELVQVDVLAIEAETDRVPVGDLVASAIAAVEHDARRKGVDLGADVRPRAMRVLTAPPRVLQNLS